MVSTVEAPEEPRIRPNVFTGPRTDIQGLRAFAVITVILDHLIGWPHGGFIGVDVFFVISGFLITGILLREHEKTGHISFTGFYRRRIKRIIPASMLVLVVTVIASYIAFGGTRARSVLDDATWAALFAGNWRFASQSTDYFQADGPTSPLQHYWSLGVEEQFYFVWPWLMLLIFALLLRRRASLRSARLIVGLVLLAVTAASFAWAMYETSSNPNQAYFSTFSRTWELGIGALLAVAAPAFRVLPGWLRPVLAWLGLAGMTASLWLVSPESTFPAPWAALPVIATAVVILAGTSAPGQQRFMWPLTNRGSGYVGDISYSLYLWHFPIIIIGVAVWGDDPVALVLMGLAIVLVSVYSFHLVEDPLRRNDWVRSRRAPRREVSKNWQVTAVSGLAVVVAAMSIAALQSPEAPNEGFSISERAQVQEEAEEQFTPAVAELQVEIRSALAATAWPEDLSPNMDEAIEEPEAPADVMPCGQLGTMNVEGCTWGPASPTNRAVIVGDSVSMTYVSVLREALPDGWALTSLGTFGCAFTAELIENPDTNITANCESRKTQAVDAIRSLSPDLVFITNTYEPRVPAGQSEPLTPAEWVTSTRSIVDQFIDQTGRVVFLAPPPSDVNLADCYSKLASPSRCVSEVTDQWEGQAEAEAALAADIGGSFVDSRDWFCADGRCPAFAAGVPMKSDQVHITPAYQRVIVSAVAETLLAKPSLRLRRSS